MNNFHIGWYVIYTKAHFENKIYEQLNKRAITSYFPTLQKIKYLANKTKILNVPMFPSYLFIHLHNLKEYYAALDLDGVITYIRFGKEVARVPEIVIDNLKILSNHHGRLQITGEHFEPGQKVIVTKGPLSGINGEVVRSGGNRKILIRISMLRQNVMVDILPGSLVIDTEAMEVS